MPELPEVETVRTGLAPAMEGQVIVQADVNRPNLRWPFPDKMAERLSGAKVLRLGRRSKYILADLSTEETLLIHLGMSGRMTVSGEGIGSYYHEHPAPEKHDHVVFHMSNDARVTFNDARRFGAMDLMKTSEQSDHWLLKDIGPEPLGNDFHDEHLIAKLKGKKTPIKTALLDQKIVAGLGNIYVCEVLFRAGIHPGKVAAKLSAKKVASLVPVIREVLTEAIDSGGSSLQDYRAADGAMGYFQHSFYVYDREGEACRTTTCDKDIGRIVQSGRSSFFCPNCQR